MHLCQLCSKTANAWRTDLWILNDFWFFVHSSPSHNHMQIMVYKTFKCRFKISFCSQYFQSCPRWRGISFCCVDVFTVWQYRLHNQNTCTVVTCKDIRQVGYLNSGCKESRESSCHVGVCGWKVGKSLKGHGWSFVTVSLWTMSGFIRL